MFRRRFIKTTAASAILMGIPFRCVLGSSGESLFINAGVGGNNTADMFARIDKDCLGHRPELTIFMAGTNDMNSKKHIPLLQYEKNMRTIISKILDIKSKIILMTILPGYEPYLFTRHDKKFYEPEGYKARMTAVNDLIKRLAVEYNLTLLDMHHIFDAVGDIGEKPSSLIQNEANSGKTDGIHPTQDGYRVMAVAIYDCIVQNRLPSNRIACFGDSITAGAYPGYLKRMLNFNN